MVINNITTERFILTKPRVKNSYSVNSKRILQKNKIELHRNFPQNYTTIKKNIDIIEEINNLHNNNPKNKNRDSNKKKIKNLFLIIILNQRL